MDQGVQIPFLRCPSRRLGGGGVALSNLDAGDRKSIRERENSSLLSGGQPLLRQIPSAGQVSSLVQLPLPRRPSFQASPPLAHPSPSRATKMMAAVMNAVLLQASLEKIGVETRVQTALMMQEVAEPYIRRRAIRHLEKGRVVIFGGTGAGTGNPLLTTDTAAALRASEINADVVLKGVIGDDEYGCPPRSNGSAPFEHISFRELAARGTSKMDMTSITCCEENNIPVVIFNMLEPGNMSRAICGDQVGTLVDQSGRMT